MVRNAEVIAFRAFLVMNNAKTLKTSIFSTKIRSISEKIRDPYAKNGENPCPERLLKSEIRAKNNEKSEIREKKSAKSVVRETYNGPPSVADRSHRCRCRKYFFRKP